MCDYCGCRRSGPTAELAAEHVRLTELRDQVWNEVKAGGDARAAFAELVDLLQRHAAKEEIGLFVHARSIGPLAAQIDTLCREHEALDHGLAGGPHGPQLDETLRLLSTHIDDEEYDLFPHIIHALDPEQWDEIELAHRAIDRVWEEGPDPVPPAP